MPFLFDSIFCQEYGELGYLTAHAMSYDFHLNYPIRFNLTCPGNAFSRAGIFYANYV